MASPRLNKSQKEAILRRVLAHAFDEREKALAAEHVTFGRRVYDDIIPADVQKLMAQLPSGYLSTNAQMRVSFGGNVVYVPLGEQRRTPHRGDYNCLHAYAGDHPLTEAHRELHARQDALREERTAAKRKAWAVLESCSTASSLLKTWPECEEFAREFLKPTASLLPTVQIHDLNKMLNLYVEGEKK